MFLRMSTIQARERLYSLDIRQYLIHIHGMEKWLIISGLKFVGNDKEPVRSESLSLGWAVNAVTGYILIGNSSGSGAGYKDWVMDELGIPSLTIEIGTDGSPLAMREVYSIFVRNLQVFPAITQWLQN